MSALGEIKHKQSNAISMYFKQFPVKHLKYGHTCLLVHYSLNGASLYMWAYASRAF